MSFSLYLIPSFLSEEQSAEDIPAVVRETIKHLRCFFVENEKAARAVLKKMQPALNIQECTLYPLNEQTNLKEAQESFSVLLKQNVGLLSESGCPCVADPGSELVLWAHQNNVRVVPLAGASSILLALMASGLNGQNFAFNGYLPKDKEERCKKIKALEKRSLTEGQTQIFMDTPYRAQHVFEDILRSCSSDTLLCLACDLTSPKENIKTLPIEKWRQLNPALSKKEVLFLIEKKG